MKWIAQCHLCGKKQAVPKEHVFMADAKKWACKWEDEHIREEHHADTDEAGSTEKA